MVNASGVSAHSKVLELDLAYQDRLEYEGEYRWARARDFLVIPRVRGQAGVSCAHRVRIALGVIFTGHTLYNQAMKVTGIDEVLNDVICLLFWVV